MQKPLSPAAFAVAAIVFTLSLLSACIVAPQDAYYRWQELNSGTTRKADWIYERLHFDKTPIDIALIGTSRTGGGLSGPGIEAAYCAATGRRIFVANLSIPETGRNMHYVIAKEAMRTKAPALTIVELNEIEARRPHRGFVMLADADDVLTAPLIGNLNYFSDLIRLPGRQVSLLFNTLAHRGAVRAQFDPRTYSGRDQDRTRELPLLDGHVISRFVAAPIGELDAGHAARFNKLSRRLVLPDAIERLEYRTARVYLEKIGRLANASDRKLAFVFLPAWREGELPVSLVKRLGVTAPIIDLGGAVANDPAKWFDATHLNAWGAEDATARMAAALADQYPDLGVPGCKQ